LAALLHGTRVLGVSQTAALNRGHHQCSAGWPSRWALAHISSSFLFHLPCNNFAFSAFTLLVGHKEEHLVCKKLSDEVLS